MFKKFLANLLALALLLNLIPTAAFGEVPTAASAHLSSSLTAASVSVGDSFDVTIASSQMTISTFTGGILYDEEYLEVESITSSSLSGSKGELAVIAEKSESQAAVGIIAVGSEDDTYAANADLAKVTFKAVREGSTALTLYEDSAGADAFKGETAGSEIIISPEAYITYVAADGTETRLTSSIIKSADLTENDNYMLSSVLDAAGVTSKADCAYEFAAADGYTKTLDADYIDDMAFFWDGSSWRNTLENNLPGFIGGWYKVKGLATITEINHAYGEDHSCTTLLNKEKFVQEACGVTEPYFNYIQADGSIVPVYASMITAVDATANGNYLLKDVLAAAGIATTADCSYKMVGSGDYTVYYDADYYEDIAFTWNKEWRPTFDTNAPGFSGKWYQVGGLVSITEVNHSYGEDHSCTNLITKGRNADRTMAVSACGAEESYVSYVAADGSSVKIYNCILESMDRTANDNVLLSDVLAAAGITSKADCAYEFAAADGYTKTLDADYFDDMAFFWDGSSWRNTLENNLPGFIGGWYKVKGLATITEINHAYGEDHSCTTMLNKEKFVQEACGVTEPYFNYIQADGSIVPVYASMITAVDATANGNYLLKDVLAAAGIATTADCSYKMVGSGDYTVYYDADYYEDIAFTWNKEWRPTFDTNAPGFSGKWYQVGGLVSITEVNHSYGEDHSCTNLITKGRNADRTMAVSACGAEESYVSYVAADGSSVKIYNCILESMDRTANDNVLLSDVLAAAGITSKADCAYIFAAADGYAKTLDADYFDDMAFFWDGSSWRNTLENNLPGFIGGWYKVKGLATITEINHAYGEDHSCTTLLNKEKFVQEACGVTEPYFNYIQADGSIVPVYASMITAVDATANGNYLLKDVLEAAGIATTADCSYKMVGSGDYTVYYDADYYEDIAFTWNKEWRPTFDTNAPGFSGKWYQVGGLVSITEVNHSYGEDHSCTNLITKGRNADRTMAESACGAMAASLEHDWVTIESKEANCLVEGSLTRECSICHKSETVVLPVTDHSYISKVTKATLTANGKIEEICSVCNKVNSVTTIYYPETIKLAATSYVYSGTVKKPSVTVIDSNGQTLDSSNYTVSYSDGLKYVGTYEAVITFTGNYSGTKTLSFRIKPANTVIESVKPVSKALYVNWKKKTTQVSGYQLKISTSETFEDAKYYTISSNATTEKRIGDLLADQKYYVVIRTYKLVDGVKYYSSWSSALEVTVPETYYPETVKLEQTAFVYDGSVKEPAVIVLDENGAAVDPAYYTVTYSTSSKKYVGTYKVSIEFNGDYCGTKTLTYKISPRPTSIKNVTPVSKALYVSWAKKTIQSSGYQLKLSASADFANSKYYTISSNAETEMRIGDLIGDQKYYVMIRTYKLVGETKYYSAWSSAVEVTVPETYYPETVKLEQTAYVYDGSVKEPAVIVLDDKGQAVDPAAYTVTYSTSSKKYVGTYKVSVEFSGDYCGTKTLSYKISPRATSITDVTPVSKALYVNWAKKTTQVSGYQLKISTSETFENAKYYTISSNDVTEKRIGNLLADQKYYVVIRTYKLVGETKYYSAWSSAVEAATLDTYYPETVQLEETSYVYDAGVKQPAVIVLDANGQAVDPESYDVAYPAGCKDVGTYEVTVEFKGDYSGTMTLSYKIIPAGTNLVSVAAETNGFTVKWEKQTEQVSGYQVKISTSSNLTDAKYYTIPSDSTTEKTISKLLANQKYYVVVRTYKLVDDTKYYSAWSAKKYVTTK